MVAVGSLGNRKPKLFVSVLKQVVCYVGTLDLIQFGNRLAGYDLVDCLQYRG